MKRTGWMVVGLCLALLPLILFAPSGCEVGSADSVVRMLGIDFSGFYQGYGTNGTQMVVPPNSGDEVTLLNLRQNGDQLEVIDNNGIVFRGVLGNLVDQTASFTLAGQTTVGNSVTVSGTLTGEGTEGTMSGTWIEPDLYATISGKAVINPAPTGVVGEINISPSDPITLSSNQNTQTYTVNDTGSPPYTWTVGSSSLGHVSPTTGSSVTYTRDAANNNTLTVTDLAGRTDTVTIIQPSSGSSTNGTNGVASVDGGETNGTENGDGDLPPVPGAAAGVFYSIGGRTPSATSWASIAGVSGRDLL
ncbi:MAG: hypothetical protein KJ726_04965 [Verrucomicrobia bacterium]|nr:hypothetical protein [Verrucomicrobiota bacterium]MBU1909380.1 hypothetical protein [Verrucomicrobiota bacterium]